MSDLSRMLGDVYGSPAEVEPPTGPEEHAPSGSLAEALPSVPSGLPAWADESVLDAAFSSWVPGPAADAPSAERTMLSDLASTPVPFVPPTPVDEATPDDLDPRDDIVFASVERHPDGYGDHLGDDASGGHRVHGWLFPNDESTVASLHDLADAAPAGMIAGTAWSRSDDDILPARRGRRRR